jgi:hypothetical protein
MLTVREDIPNEVYHAISTHRSRSSVHRYAGADGGRSQRYAEKWGKSLFSGNSSTTFGSLVDGAFEAEVRGLDWRSRCAVAPPDVLAADGSRRGGAFKGWKASLGPECMECSADDFVKVRDIIESLREHKLARGLMEAVTKSQLSVFWQTADGFDLKARADGVTDAEWFDLKTTSSTWEDLHWSFRRFGYDWQAAWYSDAAAAAGWPPFTFRFVVVQNFAPFNVRVCKLKPEALDRARSEIRETLLAMRRREESDEYVSESYHDEVELELR